LNVEFIRTHHGHRETGLVWGVEPICGVLSEHGLPIAPSTYDDHLDRRPSRRRVRDEQLEAEVVRVHPAHYGVYGARKVWLQLNREGIPVARCTVADAPTRPGRRGPRQAKRTTIANPAARLPEDLVQRRFARAAPDKLWSRHHVCLDLVGLGLRRVRGRRLRPPDPGLAHRHHDDDQARP
jgi:putative transposase